MSALSLVLLVLVGTGVEGTSHNLQLVGADYGDP
jgi:hypothetical protein